MIAGRYNFDLLYRHSNELALSSRRTFKKEVVAVKDSFGFLSQHFDRLERHPRSHSRNVKMALTSRFTNHLFAHVVLAERGLLLDAANCVRSAVETTAFYWLVCRDASTAGLYDAQESPRPVEIRKRLEVLGVDVSELRESYGYHSAVSHVGNRYDNLQISWEKERGKLQIGGGGDPSVRRAMLNEVPRYIVMFVKHDLEYVVTLANDKSSIRDGSAPEPDSIEL
jgi:antitoxin component HigA of HigAB toxin-antitoxin module